MPVLMILGPVAFETAHNLTGTSFEGETDFAEHKVLGGAPLYEHMTLGEAERTVKGIVYPNDPDFGYGSNVIDMLDRMRVDGKPQHLMRGDGTVMGWHIITKVKAEGEYLSQDGVPHRIEFTIALTRCTAPSASDFASIIGDFFR